MSIGSTIPSTSAGTSNSTSTGAQSNASAQAALSQNYNTFLTLLTTQLQNQDPLSPMDSSQFTQQLVEFSSVEQQINTNSNLTQLIALQNTSEQIQALPLVGDTISYSSATAPLSGGSASYTYSLPTSAGSVQLVVEDANGNTVYATTGNTSAGSSSYTWNGQTFNGGQEPDGGLYSLHVTATGVDGSSITPTIDASGTVTGIVTSNNTATFNVGGVSVPFTSLVSVSAGSSTGSSTTSN
jgi:flagellar basal-body rod modification protein FlgD